MPIDARRSRKFNRKRQQLCTQVQESVNLILGMSGDDFLNGCYVVEVSPHPNAGCLRVKIQTWEQITPPLVEKVNKATSWIRSELSSCIHRKKVPLLVLELTQA